MKDTLSKIFNQTTPGWEVARALMGLQQGKQRVADYAIEFCTLEVDSGWNSFSLCDTFFHSLVDRLKDQLTPLKLHEDLDSLISLSVKTDNQLFKRETERPKSSASSSVPRGRSAAASSWHSPSCYLQSTSFILPSSCMVQTVTWEIEERVRQANTNTVIPNVCLHNRLFVPVSLCSQVIHWVHTSLPHLGIRRTCFMIKQQFWWPEKEVGEYVAACVCLQKDLSMPPIQTHMPSAPWPLVWHLFGLCHGVAPLRR